jgi:hypothetical protein
MEVRAEKEKGPRKKNQRSATKKTLTVVQCWLIESQERDEKRTPILWTERPTAAVTGAAGSLLPCFSRNRCRETNSP